MSAALATSRPIAAPRGRVWAACSEPAALAAWWGPAGFTNTFHRFDFHPGGAWIFTMHAPDGTAIAMEHRFVEIVAPERIVVCHLQPGHDFMLTITLAEQDGGTRLGWRMDFDDPAEAERVRAVVLLANEQNLDRLQAYLAKPMSEAG